MLPMYLMWATRHDTVYWKPSLKTSLSKQRKTILTIVYKFWNKGCIAVKDFKLLD